MKLFIQVIVILFLIGSSVSSSSESILNLKFDRMKMEILQCESNLRHHNIWGDNHRSYGIAQFQLRTFNYLKKKAGRPELKWKSKKDQLWLFDWALRNGHGKNWTCYRNVCKV